MRETFNAYEGMGDFSRRNARHDGPNHRFDSEGLTKNVGKPIMLHGQKVFPTRCARCKKKIHIPAKGKWNVGAACADSIDHKNALCIRDVLRITTVNEIYTGNPHVAKAT